MAIPGPQELALLALIAAGIFVLRRAIQLQISQGSVPSTPGAEGRAAAGLGPGMRLAIVASLLFVIIAALLLEPWAGNAVPFISYGLLPVGVGWGVIWVKLGYGRKSG